MPSLKMKRIFLLIFCCLTIFGCKKSIFDYRSKFIGDYNFVVHETAWIFNKGTILDTVYSYNGNVGYGSDENTISITFSQNMTVDPTIYEDGTLNIDAYNVSFQGE